MSCCVIVCDMAYNFVQTALQMRSCRLGVGMNPRPIHYNAKGSSKHINIIKRYSAVVFRNIFYINYTYANNLPLCCAAVFIKLCHSLYDLLVQRKINKTQNRNFYSTFLKWYKSIAFPSHHFWNAVTVLPYILFNSESPIHLYS